MSFAEYSAISCTFSLPGAVYPRNSSFHLKLKHKKPEQFIVLYGLSYQGKLGMAVEVVSVLLVSMDMPLVAILFVCLLIYFQDRVSL